MLWRAETYDRCLAWALDEGTTPNGIFGAKLMWGYLGDFAKLLRGIEGMAGLTVPELLARAFPDVHYVRITRRDKVRRAVSLWRAVQTQAWQRERGERETRATDPVFSFRAINYLVRLLTAHDASWDACFLGLGHQPLTLTYEELGEAHEPVIRRVPEHVGVEPPAELRVERPRLTIQADELSERWVARVHEHLAALEGPEVVLAGAAGGRGADGR
ncbi:MAG TPA: Stf0 family sulfotransferase [Solirubrobacteraceae bacterium]|nr:Stf0 family sulfotransferase [Solirubrobacteraceae bacterium]